MITIKKFVTHDGKCPFDDWMQKLKDPIGKAMIINRLDRLKQGNPGDFKDLGDGVFELRLFTGPGYRIYCAWEGNTLVLLINGGDKSQQSKKISLAKDYWNTYRNEKNANI